MYDSMKRPDSTLFDPFLPHQPKNKMADDWRRKRRKRLRITRLIKTCHASKGEFRRIQPTCLLMVFQKTRWLDNQEVKLNKKERAQIVLFISKKFYLLDQFFYHFLSQSPLSTMKILSLFIGQSWKVRSCWFYNKILGNLYLFLMKKCTGIFNFKSQL